MDLYKMDMMNVSKIYGTAQTAKYQLPTQYYGFQLKFYPRNTAEKREPSNDPSLWKVYENSLEPDAGDVTDLIPSAIVEVYMNLQANVPDYYYKKYITVINNHLTSGVDDVEIKNLIFYYYVGVYLQCFPIFLPFLSYEQLSKIKRLKGAHAFHIEDKIFRCAEKSAIYYTIKSSEDIYQRLYFSPPIGLPIWVSQFLFDIKPMTNEYCAIYTPSRLCVPPNPRQSRTFHF
jgi:hypothetical protein